MIKLATPISHLFEDNNFGQSIIEHSDCLECRDRSIDSTAPNQELFHCELQPIHEWSKAELDYLLKIKENKNDLKLITFHMASSCSNPVVEKGMFQTGGKIYNRKQLLENAKINFDEIKKIFGSEIIIAVENNNYYPTDAYEYVTDSDFISEVVYENDLGFLFDVAHAKVTSYNKNVNFEKYKSELPLEKIVQVHICSYDINYEEDYAYDAHNYPNEEELIEVKKLINNYKTIRYLTVEYYRDIENLEKSLNEVRTLV